MIRPRDHVALARMARGGASSVIALTLPAPPPTKSVTGLTQYPYDSMAAVPPRSSLSGTRTAPITTLLADRPTHTIVQLLGDARARGQEAVAVTEQPVGDATPRLIRDRLRGLERAGIVEAIERAPANGGAPSLWALTNAGRDLYRLEALMARIVTRAADLPPTVRAAARDEAFTQTLTTLTDASSVALLRTLAMAAEPLDPVALEIACQPVPRRTLYRRLTGLVEQGVVTRIAGRTVPRSTRYELVERWRPVAAVPVLGAWWESRHWTAPQPSDLAALEGLLGAILPLVRLDRSHDGKRIAWSIDATLGHASGTILVRGEEVAATVPSMAGTAEATISGSPAAWSTALVTDRTDDLIVTGDPAFARDAIGAVRASMLAYVR